MVRHHGYRAVIFVYSTVFFYGTIFRPVRSCIAIKYFFGLPRVSINEWSNVLNRSSFMTVKLGRDRTSIGSPRFVRVDQFFGVRIVVLFFGTRVSVDDSVIYIDSLVASNDKFPFWLFISAYFTPVFDFEFKRTIGHVRPRIYVDLTIM